jgi:hypothetical protein
MQVGRTNAPSAQSVQPAAGRRIRCGLVLIKSLLIAGVLVLPLPALGLGLRGVGRHRGLSADDRAPFVMLVTLRVLILLLVFALSAVILLAAVGAIVRDLALPNLVYTFFGLDLLLGLLILLTFGRRDRRPARRPVNPAAR